MISTDTKTRRVALVTGAGSGIGQAIAVRLAKDNLHILAHYNSNQSGAEVTVKTIQAAGGSAEVIGFDVKDAVQVQTRLNDWCGANESSHIDVLVNNAGVHIDSLTGLISDEAFDTVMRTNAYGAFYLMRFCVRRMLRARSGNIINISSLAGQTGNAGQINYAASKAALIAMTKSLAMEVGSRGIRVNAVAPGFIETEMIKDIPGIDQMKERVPLRRFGRPEEVAGAVAFLASPDATYITGHTLSVNGGLYPA